MQGRGGILGLSMVEVLAAMVIFSAGAAVLFPWIGQSSDRLGRLSDEQRVLFAELASLEYMKTVNPMLQPHGEVRLLDGYRLHWRSRQLGAGETVRRPGSLYDVGLFQVDVSLDLGDRQKPHESSLQLAGWRQVRERSSQGPIGGGG